MHVLAPQDHMCLFWGSEYLFFCGEGVLLFTLGPNFCLSSTLQVSCPHITSTVVYMLSAGKMLWLFHTLDRVEYT